jgi:hypothetical protein
MVKMNDLRRTKADVSEDKKALGVKRDGGQANSAPDVYVPPEDEGARMEFEHHHLEKMGVHGDLKSGDTVHFNGHGTVERSESKSSTDGDRHSATIRFHHGGVDHEMKSGGGEERMALRSDIEKAHGKAEEKASSVKTDKKIPEKK